MATLLTLPHPAFGDNGETYWIAMESILFQLQANDQLLEDQIQLAFSTLFGNGVVAQSYTAPLLSIGAGLLVDIAPHITLIGFAFQLQNAATIAVPPSQAAVYIWEYQDNTDLVPHYVYTLTNVNPSVDPENPAILLGTCVTGVATVTSVNDTLRVEVLPPSKNKQPVEEYFTQATGAVNFDGNDDRTLGAGPHNTVTVSMPIAPVTVVEVGIDRQRFVKTDDWTITGQVITFVTGAAPQNGEKVWCKYVPL